MFVEKKIKQSEAQNIKICINEVLKGSSSLKWVLIRRLTSQLKKLEHIESYQDMIRNAAKSIMSEDKWDIAVARNLNIKEALGEEKLKEVIQEVDNEINSEITVQLLSEPIENLMHYEAILTDSARRSFDWLIDLYDSKPS